MRINLEDTTIFQADSSNPRLHIEFRCKYHNNDVTKDVFTQLQRFSLNSKEKTTWYQMYDDLLMRFNEEHNKIEFKEDAQSQISALILLPSLLLREWQVIDKYQKEFLETYLEHSPLISSKISAIKP